MNKRQRIMSDNQVPEFSVGAKDSNPTQTEMSEYAIITKVDTLKEAEINYCNNPVPQAQAKVFGAPIEMPRMPSLVSKMDFGMDGMNEGVNKPTIPIVEGDFAASMRKSIVAAFKKAEIVPPMPELLKDPMVKQSDNVSIILPPWTLEKIPNQGEKVSSPTQANALALMNPGCVSSASHPSYEDLYKKYLQTNDDSSAKKQSCVELYNPAKRIRQNYVNLAGNDTPQGLDQQRKSELCEYYLLGSCAKKNKSSDVDFDRYYLIGNHKMALNSNTSSQNQPYKIVQSVIIPFTNNTVTIIQPDGSLNKSDESLAPKTNLQPPSASAPSYLDVKNLTGIVSAAQIKKLSQLGIVNLEQIEQLTLAMLNEVGLNVSELYKMRQDAINAAQSSDDKPVSTMISNSTTSVSPTGALSSPKDTVIHFPVRSTLGLATTSATTTSTVTSGSFNTVTSWPYLGPITLPTGILGMEENNYYSGAFTPSRQYIKDENLDYKWDDDDNDDNKLIIDEEIVDDETKQEIKNEPPAINQQSEILQNLLTKPTKLSTDTSLTLKSEPKQETSFIDDKSNIVDAINHHHNTVARQPRITEQSCPSSPSSAQKMDMFIPLYKRQSMYDWSPMCIELDLEYERRFINICENLWMASSRPVEMKREETEINASILAVGPTPYQVKKVEVPEPKYSYLRYKSPAYDSSEPDPRLRRAFGLPELSYHRLNQISFAKIALKSRAKPSLVTNSKPGPASQLNVEIQILIEKSSWYKNLTAQYKIIVNQQLALLSNKLKRFYLDPAPNKAFDSNFIETNQTLQMILTKLGVYINENGLVINKKAMMGLGGYAEPPLRFGWQPDTAAMSSFNFYGGGITEPNYTSLNSNRFLNYFATNENYGGQQMRRDYGNNYGVQRNWFADTMASISPSNLYRNVFNANHSRDEGDDRNGSTDRAGPSGL